MFQIFLIFYRLLATLVVLTPLMINLTIKGDVIASLVYAPSLTIVALVLAIYFDSKVVDFYAARHKQSLLKKTTLKFAHAPLLSRFKSKQCCLKH